MNRKELTFLLVAVLLLLFVPYKLQAKVSFTQAQKVFVKLQGVSGQYISLKLNNDEVVEAYSTAYGVFINQGMLDALYTEDQLAMVLGHELAHIVAKDYIYREAKSRELKADKLGYYYCKKAGYKSCLSWFVRMSQIYPGYCDEVHPPMKQRLKLLQRGE